MATEYCFTVNGMRRTTTEKKSLLRYLRDDLHLFSVKDGCSEGACGTCTIIVDGVAVKACVLTTDKSVGRNIVTVEGLTEREQDAFVYAFGSKGSVQCGFCIPGMVMAGKALIDQNPDPTEEEIKYALRGNICRCTGYKKIIEGIQLTAAILRGDAEIDYDLERGEQYGVGQRAFRVDVRKKVLGYGKYPDDIVMDGMVHLSAVRSKYPRARVLKIDASKAEALPGVLGVLTAKDVPNNKVGHIQQDWDVMIAEGDITRMIGDTICVVVAETEEILEKAKKLVKVDYEKLEPIRNVHEAMAEDAPQIHSSGNLCQQRHVTRGDAKTALEKAAYKVTRSFTTPFTEHAFLEPECAVSFPYKDGIKILSTDQGAFDTRKEVSIMFGWDPEKIVVENQLIGGGFGGKEDVTVQHLTALAAYKYQRPVKAKFTRQESLFFHPKRHAMEGTFTLGCDENGILMICDEVMAGFGRTGKVFAFEHWNVKPDIITFAKGVTSGYVQLGGIMISKEIAKFYEDKVFQYGLTYSGHSLACAAGVACVNYYKKAGLLENTQKVGKVLGELLEEIKQKHKCVGDVRYIGLFAAVEFVKDKETKEPLVPYADQSGTMGKIIGLLKERGFATFGRENNINIAPPLIITEEQLREAMKIFDEVLDIVDETYL